MGVGSEEAMEVAAVPQALLAAGVHGTEVESEAEATSLVYGGGLQSRRPRAGLRLFLMGSLALAAVSALAIGATRRTRRVGGLGGKGLTQLEEVEARAGEGRNESEKPPDQGMGFPDRDGEEGPTLFCFSVMNCANGAEVETIKGQLRSRIGIFACDNVAVISGCKMNLGNGHKLPNGSHVQVMTWLNPAAPAPMGVFTAGDNTNSFKNTDIFIRAWDMLISSKVVFGHDWLVKADPDAVFFADRMRRHLTKHSASDKPFYLKNCNYKGQAALYGSIEVFNANSVKRYADAGDKCKQLDWVHWGEDQWIDTCMWQMLGAIPVNDFELVGDHRCMSAECEDTWRAAFHDYKSWASYENCWHRSRNAEKNAAMVKDSNNFCCTWSWDASDPCNKCGSKTEPGGGYCGTNKGACSTCGQAVWCQRANGTATIA